MAWDKRRQATGNQAALLYRGQKHGKQEHGNFLTRHWPQSAKTQRSCKSPPIPETHSDQPLKHRHTTSALNVSPPGHGMMVSYPSDHLLLLPPSCLVPSTHPAPPAFSNWEFLRLLSCTACSLPYHPLNSLSFP